MLEDIEQFGVREVFGVGYRDMTPFHKHFIRQARLARKTYQEQEARRQRNAAK